MKTHVKTNFLALGAVLLISSITWGQGSIVFSPSNPSVCSGESISISAQFVATPPPPLNFPYTKLTGTEIYVSTSGSNTTGNGTLANPYLTIQHAISNAVNGQIVTILPGTYTGSGNVNISTQGKQITVQSDQGPITTIIDCALNGRGFLINQGETMTTVIKGLSIINGKTNAAPLLYGSGIFVEDNSGVKIVDCFFINNQEGCIQLGDTEVSGPQSGIENCSFIGNFKSCINASKKSFYTESCFFYSNTTSNNDILLGNGHVADPSQYYQNCIFKCNNGFGIVALGHGKTLNNSLFIDNSTVAGTVYVGTNWSGTNTVNHCTFYNNSCNYFNAGWGDHTGQVLSSIFYPGAARNHVSGYQASIPFSNSLGDGITGNGNIQGNPLFVDPTNFNFNLAAGSPCIGTGASGSNMGADMSLIPLWMFNFLEHYSGSFDNILWENGQSTDTINLTINQSQYVSVQFSNCGTIYTDSVWVEVNNLPTINAGNDTTACIGSDFTLSATGGVDYVWTNNILNGVPFQVTSASWFYVTGSDTNGCSASDSIFVSVIDPTISAAQSAFCLGDSTIISLSNVGGSCGTISSVLQTGLAAWYPFCSNADDLSSLTNNGTVNGTVLTDDYFSNPNAAYSFNGTSSTINLTNPFLNGGQANQFTMNTRVNFNSLANSPNIWGKTKFWGEVNFGVDNNGKVFLIWANSITGNKYSSIVSQNGVITTNTWYDITVVFQSGTGQIYINGQPIATSLTWTAQGGAILSTTSIENSCNFSQDANSSKFGVRIAGGSPVGYLNGVLDEFRIWDYALSPTLIQQNFEVSNFSSIWWSDGTTNQSSIQVQPTQTTMYSVTVSDGVGTCTDSITIQVNNPQINAGSDLSVCEGETATLTATGADTYAWDNGVVNGQPFTPIVDGYYTVTGTDTLGCSNTVSVFLDVLQPTSSTITPVSCDTYTAPDNEVYTNSGQYTAIIPNAAGCDSTITINLTVNNSNSGTDAKTACDSYTWIDGNTYTASTTSPTFTLQNANGCDSVVTLNLIINKLQGLNAGDDITACQGDNITLAASGATTYSWTGGATNAVAFIPPTGTTIYTVTGTDDNGCTATDAVSVLVEYCLDIPGGISPNGDNANDTWTIIGLDQYPDAKVLVFDRWGQKVFSGDATNATWNGTYEGKELPTADYYYIIELGNGEKFNGVVTLKR